MILVVVKNPIRPKFADDFPKLVEEFTAATRAEPGNICFDWYRSVDDPNMYVLVEAFEDAAAGEAHVNSEHFKQATAAATDAVRRHPRDRQRRGARRLVADGRGPGRAMSPAKKTGSQPSKSPARLIDARIKELGDWRGAMLGQIRAVVKDADPEVVEEWKWRGVPVWYHDGMICTGETHKSVVKMTFAKGAALKDPSGLFNSSLEGNTRRAIDFHEGDKINKRALKALIREAVALNESKART